MIRCTTLRSVTLLLTVSLCFCTDKNPKTTPLATTHDSSRHSTVAQKTNETKSQQISGMLCINNYGECISVNSTCERKRAIVKGICDSPNQVCCLPSQDEQTGWGTQDENCIRQFGECLLDTMNCTGSFQVYECGGPSHRRCCIPDAEDVRKWEEGDKICKDSLGSCQLKMNECKGQYQSGTCGGPKQRQCCLPGEDVRSTWEKHDGPCHEKFGECVTPDVKCSGKRDKTMCGGPEGRQCCIPDKDVIKSWEEKDKECLLVYGKCDRSIANCTGSFSDKCGGPSYRKCCAPDLKNVEEWKKDDAMCNEKGGVCQSIGLKCHTKYIEGYCGGPSQVRRCCLSPVKEEEKTESSTAENTKDQHEEDSTHSTTESILKKFSSNRTLVLSVSIPTLVVLVGMLICLVRKRGTCCRPYRTLRGDPKKTPWYKMEYGEMDDDEDVNLTMAEEAKTYA